MAESRSCSDGDAAFDSGSLRWRRQLRADLERFCELDIELDQAPDPLELSPDEGREAAHELKGLMDEVVKVAPDEIRSEVASLAGRLDPMFDLLESVDFDVEQIDDAELDAVFDVTFGPKNEDSGEVVTQWIPTNC